MKKKIPWEPSENILLFSRDAQITQLKIEGDVARSQASNLRKESDELKVKLLDYEKMSKFQRAVATDPGEVEGLRRKVQNMTL